MTKTINSRLNEQLRQRIAVMSDGEKFPTEAELCEEFSVSRMTVSKVLHEITRDGLLERAPRRGTFVRKSFETNLNHASEWLNESHSGGLLAGAVTHTLRVNIYEYRHEFIRSMWDELAAKLKGCTPGVEIEFSTEPEDAEQADIIWASNRRDLKALNSDSFNTSEAARAAIARHCPEENYFAAAWPDLKRSGKAGCPFSLSASVYLWNDRLAEEHCPGLKQANIRQMTEFFIAERKRFASELPPAIFYVFVPFLLMQLASSGILEYDLRHGLSGFDKPEVAGFLKFNREIFAAAARLSDDRIVTEIRGAMNLFLSGKALALNTFSPTLKVIPENRVQEFSVSSAPIGPYAPAVPVYMGIGPNCRDLETAAATIGFFCGRRGQRILARHRNNIPALREMAYSEEFLKKSPRNMKQVLDVLDTASDVINLEHFMADKTGYCRKFSHYILEEIELTDLFNNTATKYKEVCNP
jgi:DNA-binding transcriptional regulator YhcF (GntR family)